MHRLKTDTEHKVWIVVGNQDYLIYSELLKSDRRYRYQIKQYESALEALAVLEVFPQETPDCILLDWELPDLNREEFLQQLNTDQIPAIVLASQKSEEIVALAAQDYLVKETLTKELLCRTVGYAIAQVKLQQKLAEAETKLQKYQLAEQELKQPEIHKQKTYPEQAVNLLLQSIHSSFDLSTIFIAATTAIGKLLQLDRVEIIQYLPDREIWISIAEYQDQDQTAIPSTLGTETSDRDDDLFFRLKQGEIVCINRSTEVNSNVSRALVEESSSYIIVPLVVGSGIWGLLSLECTGRERYWQDLEIDLASNMATQLGVAIQQSLFFQELQTELRERKRAELALQKLNQELELRIEQRTAMLRISGKNLQINERRFRSFFDFAPIGIAVTDIKTDQLIAVNQSFCQLLGYSETEILSFSFCLRVSPVDDWESEISYAESLVQGKISSYQIEKQYIKKNGEIILTNLTKTVIKDEEGNVTYLIGMFEDITERKQAETALRESQKFLQTVLDTFPLFVFWKNRQSAFLGCNQNFARGAGLALSTEIIGKTDFDMPWGKTEADTYRADDRQVMDTGEAKLGIIETQTQVDGSIIWLETNKLPLRSLDGEVIGVLGTYQDISDRKNAEAALRQQMEHQHFIMDITQQIRQSLDLDRMLTTAVNEIKRLLHCDRVIILQLFQDGVSKVVKEIVEPGYPSIFNQNLTDEYFFAQHCDLYINPSPHIVNDVAQDDCTDYLSGFMKQANIKSKILAPIMQHIQLADSQNASDIKSRCRTIDSHLWGLLIVHSCGEYRRWQTEEADLLQQLANQLAIAIQQADLYQQIQNELSVRQQFQQELQKQAAADRLLSEITVSITQSASLDEVLNMTLEKVRKFLESDRIIIFQFDSDWNGVVVKEVLSRSELSILGKLISDSCFATTDLAEEYVQGKVAILEDVLTANLTTCYSDLLQEFQVRANLVAPIIHSNKLWGLLIVHQCDAPRAWLPDEVNLVKQIATQIGIAAQKERLYLQVTSELSQKKVLLKEIHHRVKNNLQIMSSLLYMQFRNTTSEVKVLSEEYQNRIQSMALIHDQLYRSDDLSSIDFHQYVTNLITNLFQCYGANPHLIQTKLDISNIFLSLDQSIPLGLIINELVSNALKYAFPQLHGEIIIQITQSEERFNLIVADNGIGVSQDVDLTNTDSLGMQLVLSLTEQLGGEFTYERKNGSNFQITFPIS